MVEEEQRFAIRGEEDDLFPLQKPNKEIVLKQRLAFKHDSSYTIVDVGKKVQTNARLTGYDNPTSTLRYYCLCPDLVEHRHIGLAKDN